LNEYFWKKDGIEIEDDGSNGTAEKGLSVEKKVKGGDFTGAGAAASKIKQLLKKLPISPKTVRRVAIASYEAEINVVAHADGGKIIAFVSPDNVKVVIADDGPGIPDIEQAMVPGYSTASEEVREMGFGAGLGLPNIKNNVDVLKITSEEGEGTTVIFYIFFNSDQ
jgi:anti-sigma regulatory factor (Ser/Thr protein kinase)